MKRCIKFFLVLCAMMNTGIVEESMAEDTGFLARSNFSGTATLTTDYVFRGLSQTDKNPAAQVSFDYNHPVGVFLGAWASNVANSVSEGNLEIDLYGGYKGQLSENLGFELSAIYYWYPGGGNDPEPDYLELHGGVNYAFANIPLEPKIGLGLNYSPDFYGEDGNAYYINGTLRLTLPYKFGLRFEVGYQNVEGDKTTGNGGGPDSEDGYDYLFWHISLSREILGFNLDLSYWDTNEEQYFGTIGDDLVVFTISRSF